MIRDSYGVSVNTRNVTTGLTWTSELYKAAETARVRTELLLALAHPTWSGCGDGYDNRAVTAAYLDQAEALSGKARSAMRHGKTHTWVVKARNALCRHLTEA